MLFKVLPRAVLAAAAVSVAASASAAAGPPSSAAEFESHFSVGYGEEEQPLEPSTRDPMGNRVILNGRFIASGSTLSGGLMDAGGDLAGVGVASAVGNQLNVVTNGSYNTIIITSEQTNTGDVIATTKGQ